MNIVKVLSACAVLLALQTIGAMAQTSCSGYIRQGAISAGTFNAIGNAATRTCKIYDTTTSFTVPSDGVHISSAYTPGDATYQIAHHAYVAGSGVPITVICGGAQSGPAVNVVVNLPSDTETKCSFSYTDGNSVTIIGETTHFAGDDPINVTGYRHALTQFDLENGPFDRTDPTPTLSWADPLLTGPVAVTLSFDEDVVGFGLGNLTLDNLSASALSGSGDSFSFTVTPIADGPVSVGMARNVVDDVNGNGNEASNILTGTADLLAPGLNISGLPGSIVDATPIAVTFAFSEDVTGFDLGDIVVSGGSIANLQGGPAVYTATVTPSGVADLTVSVGSGAAQDVALRDSAAAQASAPLDSAAIASEANALFMLNRANQLLSNQPGLSGLLRGDPGHFNAEITNGQGVVDFYSGGAGPFWADVAASWSTSGTAQDTYILGTIGVHRRFGDNLLAGVMLELDYMDEVDGLAHISGWGWLVGPYVVAKLPDHPLYFDARLLYGQSYNQASPLGTFTDEFNTQRWLAMVNVSGDIALGWGTLSPHLRAAWTQDSQGEYVDGASTTVAAQTVSLTQIVAGAKLDVPLGALELHLGADAVWSATRSDLLTLPSYEGARGRLSFGADYALPSGGALSLTLGYDGLGTPDYEAVSVNAALNLPF